MHHLCEYRNNLQNYPSVKERVPKVKDSRVQVLAQIHLQEDSLISKANSNWPFILLTRQLNVKYIDSNSEIPFYIFITFPFYDQYTESEIVDFAWIISIYIAIHFFLSMLLPLTSKSLDCRKKYYDS